MTGLVARQALNLAHDLIDEFSVYNSFAQNEAILQSKYIAIVVLLRSVGHALLTTDCAEEPYKKELTDRWKNWRQEDIFKDFILPTRNALVKEFSEGLNFRRDDPAMIFSGVPSGRTGAVISINIDPNTVTDVHGRLVLPLFRQALAFWNRCLGEIEAHR